jgi:hypothetical protein
VIRPLVIRIYDCLPQTQDLAKSNNTKVITLYWIIESALGIRSDICPVSADKSTISHLTVIINPDKRQL